MHCIRETHALFPILMEAVKRGEAKEPHRVPGAERVSNTYWGRLRVRQPKRKGRAGNLLCTASRGASTLRLCPPALLTGFLSHRTGTGAPCTPTLSPGPKKQRSYCSWSATEQSKTDRREEARQAREASQGGSVRNRHQTATALLFLLDKP